MNQPNNRKKEASAPRKQTSGQTGLANAARPGLGMRPSTPEGDAARIVELDSEGFETNPAPLPLPPKPKHEPEEQDSASLAQEWQRDTGVSGHSSST